MKRPPLSWLMIAPSLLLGGCAGIKVEDYAGTTPRLIPEEYFAGYTSGTGLVQDRAGRVRRQFTIEMHGHWEDDVFVLNERFLFDDGERTERTWRLEKIDDHHYRATAGDVVGEASATAYGPALNMRYVFQLPVKGKTYEVKFDDWIYLQPDGSALNRATMRKFGVRLGEVLVHFQPQQRTPGPDNER